MPINFDENLMKTFTLYASLEKIQQISHITYMFTFRYAFNLTEIDARFCHNNKTIELSSDTLPFKSQIIRIAWENIMEYV